MKRIRIHVLLLIGLSFASAAAAMDRWAALSMIESGNDDRAVGSSGEITRFQIRHELWAGGDPRDVQIALSTAQNIMRLRLDAFEHTHKRTPTDFEFYVLWNAPLQVNHPSVAVTDRASRFVDLVRR